MVLFKSRLLFLPPLHLVPSPSGDFHFPPSVRTLTFVPVGVNLTICRPFQPGDFPGRAMDNSSGKEPEMRDSTKESAVNGPPPEDPPTREPPANGPQSAKELPVRGKPRTWSQKPAKAPPPPSLKPPVPALKASLPPINTATRIKQKCAKGPSNAPLLDINTPGSGSQTSEKSFWNSAPPPAHTGRRATTPRKLTAGVGRKFEARPLLPRK